MPASTQQGWSQPSQAPFQPQSPFQQQPIQPRWTPAPPSPAEAAGRNALIWALVGFFLCLCFPVSLVGLVLGIRSRKLAAQQNVTVPATGTIAIVLSSVSIFSFVAFSIWFAIDSARLSARVEELTARVARADTAEILAQQTACDLAELRLLTDGWTNAEGSSTDPIGIDGVECPGQITQKESEAEVPDFSFSTTNDGRVTVTVCYKRGARWTVKEFRQSGGCLDHPIAEPPMPE